MKPTLYESVGLGFAGFPGLANMQAMGYASSGPCSLESMSEQTTYDPPARMCGNLLEAGSVSILTGHTSHGKSTRVVMEAIFLALEGAESVLYALEDNLAITQARLNACIEHHGLEKSLLDLIHTVGPGDTRPKLEEPEQAEEWTQAMIDMFSGPGRHCLFIDSITSFAGAQLDLNNDQVATGLMNRFLNIARDTQDPGHVRIVAPARKPHSANPAPPRIHDVRGSGAFGQLVRTGHVLFKTENDGYDFIFDKDSYSRKIRRKVQFNMQSVTPSGWPHQDAVGVFDPFVHNPRL